MLITMKKSIETMKYRLMFFLLMLFNVSVAFAQEGGTGDGGSVTVHKSTSTTTSNTLTEDWYTQPWVWIVGAAIFILLLIALVRGGSSDRVKDVHRTTVRRETRTD
jgi:hypothetical protein